MNEYFTQLRVSRDFKLRETGHTAGPGVGTLLAKFVEGGRIILNRVCHGLLSVLLASYQILLTLSWLHSRFY